VHRTGLNSITIRLLREGGQHAKAAIIGATSQAAESIGLQTQIGALTPGFGADLVGVNGNPLQDVTGLRACRSSGRWPGISALRPLSGDSADS
jgi:imidazolonepropionase-like amidohydrolase